MSLLEKMKTIHGHKNGTDYFEHVKKTIDKNAQLMTYDDYVKKKDREEKEYQQYLANKERERYGL